MSADPVGFDQRVPRSTSMNATLVVNDGEPNEIRLDMSGQVDVVCRVVAAAADAIEDELR